MSIAKSLVVVTLNLLVASPALAVPSACVKALVGVTSVKVDGIKFASTSTISKFSGGKINSLQLDTARNTSYMIEVPKRSSNSSNIVEVKLSDMADKLSKNIEVLENTQTSRMSVHQSAIHASKAELARMTAELITLGARKYKGSDAELIMARDAFARQVETAVKMTSKENTAKLEEFKEHKDFIEAIIAEKKKNPSLTDAEATARGVQKAYKESFEKRCQDGSCKVPTDAVLAAGAKNRLKELKECI